MKAPWTMRAAGRLLLAWLMAGCVWNSLSAEPVPARSADGWVKRTEGAKAPSIQALGPSHGPVHYQQSFAQPLLPPALEAGLPHESVSEAKGRLPIGFSRVFDPAIVVSAGTAPAEAWTVLPNGWRIWSVQLASPGALGVRLHLQALALPKGARLVVYDAANPKRTVVAATAGKLPPEREVWAKAVFADNVVLECQVPPGADTAEVNFAVTELSHMYRLPRVVAKDQAGPCQKDVTCYPTWAQEAAGVAEMSFIDDGTNFLCTGCLLSNGTTNTANEYFLSAHHCIPNQTVASTLELFWFYQTSTCNGTPPSIYDVPQTAGGAQLLATSVQSDFAFMQLRDPVPDGVFFLGWSREAPLLSDTLVCIQHPHGDYKRISFGNLSTFNAGFWTVQWAVGVTEPGSSGSPLLNPRHQVIGQLWGGSSDCTFPQGLDDFGRFDVTYNFIYRWIDPVSLLRGNYSGLFMPTNGAPFSGAGSVTLTITATGKFTGKLQAGSLRYALQGQFDVQGNAQVTAAAGHLTAVNVTLHLDTTGLSDRLTGFVNGGTWSATLAADRADLVNPSTQQGTYTLVLPGNYGSTNQPGGDGYATVSVDKVGRLRLTGLLADGTKFTQSTVVSKAGQWPLYVPLYGNAGYLLSWVTFSNTAAGELGGDLAWVKPAGKTTYYPGGFNLETSVVGARYTRPAAGEPLLSAADAALILTGGNPTEGLTNSFALSGQKAVSVPATKLHLSFAPATGLFRGSVVADGTPKPLQFSGVVLANQNAGAGYFLNGGQSGRVLLQPAP